MKLKIFNCDWEIKECSNNEIPMCDGTFYGRTFYFEKHIYLNKDLAKDQKVKTLMHELGHAFISETQIFTQEKSIEYTEEMLCEFMGNFAQEICKITNFYFENVNI